MNARDIMDPRFHVIRPDHTIDEAVAAFITASREEQKKVFGLMVIDTSDRLVGMLSMYDILLFIRPKHMHIWGEMADLDVTELFEGQLQRVKTIQVADIMTTAVVTVTPETPLLVIIDLMIKKHIRRLPVVDGRQVVGIVYLSDVFNRLADTLLSPSKEPA